MPTRSKTKHKDLLKKKDVARQYVKDNKTKEESYSERDKLKAIDRIKFRGWPISGASVVLIDNKTGELILRKDKDDKRGLFGGNRIKAEHPHDCAARLLKEQSKGIVNIDGDKLLKESKWTGIFDKVVKCQYRCFVYGFELDTKFDSSQFDIERIKLKDIKQGLREIKESYEIEINKEGIKMDKLSVEMLQKCIEEGML